MVLHAAYYNRAKTGSERSSTNRQSIMLRRDIQVEENRMTMRWPCFSAASPFTVRSYTGGRKGPVSDSEIQQGTIRTPILADKTVQCGRSI